jgi:predicted CxxxxCH...CXXCH cytochrome family protein
MRCARSATSKALLSAAAVVLAGCGVVRPSGFESTCPSYQETIRPLVESSCASCHGADRSEGGYVVGEYTQTVSRRPDGTAFLAPGDADTAFLRAVRGELPGHEALGADETAQLTSWVLGCRAGPGEPQFHPRGWSTPTEQGLEADGGALFHGKALRQKFYRFGECQQCHGEDLRGGKTNSDCATCHEFQQGQLACNTCHGDGASAAPPKALDGSSLPTTLGVGAHRAHVTASPTHRALECTECHREVRTLEDEGHYRRNNVFQIDFTTGQFLPAEVVLGKSNDAGTASWDRGQATCTNTACHAPWPGDTAAMNMQPVWTTVGQAGCGSCHGNPPSSHPQDQLACETCHGAGYEAGKVNVETHVNGVVDFRGGDASRCDSCHSGPRSPEFVDLQGRTADAGSSVRTVGAHDAHLKASRMRGPMTCNECHLVPSTLFAPGHIDSSLPAEVFPMGFTGISANQAVMPVYDATNATCTTYCHSGAGDVDMAPGLNRMPSWTGGPSQATCGTCHGLPPQDNSQWHALAATTPCATCHGGSIDADGGLIFTSLPDGGVSSKHVDGRVTGQ